MKKIETKDLQKLKNLKSEYNNYIKSSNKNINTIRSYKRQIKILELEITENLENSKSILENSRKRLNKLEYNLVNRKNGNTTRLYNKIVKEREILNISYDNFNLYNKIFGK